MKRIPIYIILIFLFSGCSLFQSAPVHEYMEQEQIPMASFGDLGITAEMEDRLVKAFAEQVDWTEYDQRDVELARSAIKSELLWIKQESLRSGYVNFYEANGSYRRVQFWWGDLMTDLDKMVMGGEVDQDTSLIYYFVRKLINQNLAQLNVSLDKSKASINSKANKYTVDQFRDLADNLSPLLMGIL